MKVDWEERRKISDFLYKKGWQITKSELMNVLDEYGFREEYENLTKHNKDFTAQSVSPKVCPDCKGTGEIFNDEPDEEEFFTCDKCGGTGKARL